MARDMIVKFRFRADAEAINALETTARERFPSAVHPIPEALREALSDYLARHGHPAIVHVEKEEKE